MKWSVERIKGAVIGTRSSEYLANPKSEYEKNMFKTYPHLANFEALSIGDIAGQALLIPLDESSREVAEYVLRAIKAYEGE